MNIYTAFNLNIKSDIEFFNLLPATSDTVDLTIIKGQVSPDGLANPDVARPFSQMSPNAVWLNIPDVARFEITNGCQIMVDPAKNADAQSIRLFIMGSCMGAILHQRNRLVIHGNAIRFGDESVIFAGASGAGKSTLAAAFHARGYEVLADDLAVIDENCCVVPAYPGMKLWQDSAKKLDIATDGLQRIRYQIEKFAYPIGEQFCATPLPVRAVYLLNSHNQPDFEFSPITGFAKFNPLKRNTYRIGYLKGLGLNATHLKLCSAVANRVALTRIMRPNDGFKLNELVEHILDDLGDGAAA